MSGLSIAGLCVDRVGQPVVRDVDLNVPPGHVTVLLGANGVGKSTLLDGLTGVAPIRGGSIELDGTDLTRASRGKRVRAGMAYVQQGRAIFATLTVEENFAVTAKPGQFDIALDLFPELKPRLKTKTALLSGGEQQMVVLGRALLQRPSVLLIDELSLGLAPIVVDRMLEAVRALAADGLGVLLVEQFADKALGVGDEALVMARGEIVLRQSAATLLVDPSVLKQAYLGGAVEPSPTTRHPEPAGARSSSIGPTTKETHQ